MVICDLSMPKPPVTKRSLTFRKWKEVDMLTFEQEISDQLVFSGGSSVDEKVIKYNTVLTELANKHAPLQSRTVTIRPSTPWFNDNIKEANKIT
jgi:hypothetical protein